MQEHLSSPVAGVASTGSDKSSTSDTSILSPYTSSTVSHASTESYTSSEGSTHQPSGPSTSRKRLRSESSNDLTCNSTEHVHAAKKPGTAPKRGRMKTIVRPPHQPGKFVALSTQCVFVLVGSEHVPMLARVAIVDYRGNVILDIFIQPTHPVADYNTQITGIDQTHLFSPSAWQFHTAIAEVKRTIKGRVLVGHSLWHHFSIMGISHPTIDTRDICLFLPFHRTMRKYNIKGPAPLDKMVSILMRRKIGYSYQHPVSGEYERRREVTRHATHDMSCLVEEARAALDLFRSYEDPWEDTILSGIWPSALPPSTFKEYFS